MPLILLIGPFPSLELRLGDFRVLNELSKLSVGPLRHLGLNETGHAGRQLQWPKRHGDRIHGHDPVDGVGLAAAHRPSHPLALHHQRLGILLGQPQGLLHIPWQQQLLGLPIAIDHEEPRRRGLLWKRQKRGIRVLERLLRTYTSGRSKVVAHGDRQLEVQRLVALDLKVVSVIIPQKDPVVVHLGDIDTSFVLQRLQSLLPTHSC
mmetsp:Transcript_74647/g.178062  ORF Transcript_74647/g.178062 Transcript_74647/m.178062 type:complete len:206 (-) Transcript_74647:3804-4421(-)